MGENWRSNSTYTILLTHVVSLLQYRALLGIHLLLHEGSLLPVHAETVWSRRYLIRGKTLKSLETELLVGIVGLVLLSLHGGLIHWIWWKCMTCWRPCIKMVLVLVQVLRDTKLVMGAKVLRRGACDGLGFGDFVKRRARVGARVLDVVAIVSGVDRGEGIEVDVAEFEKIAQIVEVVVNVRHLVELFGWP